MAAALSVAADPIVGKREQPRQRKLGERTGNHRPAVKKQTIKRKEAMADDPNLKHVDSWFVSSQPHEYHYFKSSMKTEFPAKTDDEIARAIIVCRKAIAPSEGREKLKACVREKLGG